VGRNGPGIFAVIAEPHTFHRYGTTLKEYYSSSVEASHLYLANRFVQFAHARCLAEELDMCGVINRKTPPCTIEWPAGFVKVFDFAVFGGNSVRPREFDHIAQIGADAPHYNYPLRHVPEESFVVRQGGGRQDFMPDKIGRLSLQQAIRESFPGAVYLHLAERWRVQEWRNSPWERGIRVSPTRSRAFTEPLIRTFVNLSVEREGLLEGHFRKGPTGFLAECQLQISERVEGYKERNEKKLYRDLRQRNPAMTPKTREFRTTGVVFRIAEKWITEEINLKHRLARALRAVFLREYSISPQDVDVSATNIAIVERGQRRMVSDAIVLYDATHGSLRLTEPAYAEFRGLIGRLQRANALASCDDDLVLPESLEKLSAWYQSLEPGSPEGFLDLASPDDDGVPEGWQLIYAVGSVLSVRDTKGVLRDVKVLEPIMLTHDGPARLFYRYQAAGAVHAMVAADKLEPVGDEYCIALWNPSTNEFRQADDDFNESPRAVDRPIAHEETAVAGSPIHG